MGVVPVVQQLRTMPQWLWWFQQVELEKVVRLPVPLMMMPTTAAAVKVVASAYCYR
jgi:hypothetical protein